MSVLFADDLTELHGTHFAFTIEDGIRLDATITTDLVTTDLTDYLGMQEPDSKKDWSFECTETSDLSLEPAQEPMFPQEIPVEEPSALDLRIATCYALNLKVLQYSKLVADDYLQLPKILKNEVRNTLKMNLNPAGLAKLDAGMAGETIRFASDDFHKLKKRKDESLKKVMSIVLKVIYRQYLHSNRINQSFNPRTYIKREEINRRIFKKYFGRDPYILDELGRKLYPVRDPELASAKTGNKKAPKGKPAGKVHLEHMRIFLIKNGVTREWFEYATGQKGGDLDWKFFRTIQRILTEERFLKNYRKKIQSMLGRIWKISGAKQASIEQQCTESEASTADPNETQGEEDFLHMQVIADQGHAEFAGDFDEKFWREDAENDEEDAQSTAHSEAAGEQKETTKRTAKHPNSILQIKEAVKIALECLNRFHMNPTAN